MTKAEALRSWMNEMYPDINWDDHMGYGYINPVSQRYFILVLKDGSVLFPHFLSGSTAIQWKEAMWEAPNFFERVERSIASDIEDIRRSDAWRDHVLKSSNP